MSRIGIHLIRFLEYIEIKLFGYPCLHIYFSRLLQVLSPHRPVITGIYGRRYSGVWSLGLGVYIQ